MGSGLRTFGIVVIVAVLLGGAASLQALRETRFPPPPAAEDTLYVSSGQTLRRLTVGYQALAADLYWIRAIQYYGGVKLRLDKTGTAAAQAGEDTQKDYALLYPLLDLTTTLDPHFNIAYRFGAIFLAEPRPGGAGRPDLAVKLLEKGLAARPDKWEYMQDIGFVHYWWRHDYAAAASWFDKASNVNGAPWFLRSLAATTLAEGGDRKSSRTMWQAIRESAEIDWLRNDAERRLMQLDAADFIDQVQADVNRARAAGLQAGSWQELIRAGGVRGIPVDPTRTPLELGPDGVVRLSRQSPLFPLPEEPQAAAPLPR
jgi:tetratricopeptide (TPR) repeat protein